MMMLTLPKAGIPPTPRVDGAGAISVRQRGEKTALETLRQQGSAKILLPNRGGQALEAVLLNTAGGLTGGDRLRWTSYAGPDCQLTITTQAAERAYRANPGETAFVETRLTAAQGARIDWLPQETILFDGCALTRHLDVSLSASSRLLMVEPILFGRKAMGERLTKIAFRDHWHIRRDGKLIYADALRLEGEAHKILAGPATLNGAAAMASAVYAAEDAEAHLAPLLALLPDSAGASLIRPGVLAVRMVARDGFALRRGLMPILEHLHGSTLPKVWTM